MPLTCVLLGHSILLAAGQSCVCTRRDGNKWSSHFCRRQWSLVDNATLRYQQLNAFDAALQRLDQKYGVMSSPHLLVSHDGSANKEPQQVSGMLGLLALLALLACLPACLGVPRCTGSQTQPRAESGGWPAGHCGRAGAFAAGHQPVPHKGPCRHEGTAQVCQAADLQAEGVPDGPAVACSPQPGCCNRLCLSKRLLVLNTPFIWSSTSLPTLAAVCKDVDLHMYWGAELWTPHTRNLSV